MKQTVMGMTGASDLNFNDFNHCLKLQPSQENSHSALSKDSAPAHTEILYGMKGSNLMGSEDVLN